MFRETLIAVWTIATLVCAAFVHAQEYPSKVVTRRSPPGGPIDTVARLIAQSMTKELIVENVAGAGGTIATNHVSRLARVLCTQGYAEGDNRQAGGVLQIALRDDPAVVQRFADLGTEPVAANQATPAALRAKLKSEVDKWAPIIKKAWVYAE